ncbi:hypothetical protein [Leptolyngbya sp. NIES-2104]|uniref:hypothetical protein n=1 Tax=Leptolyngbya sp. NIES-2104 TaxID=1552121 RepID=UPI0006EC8397|nr:hypothetical protein [Leptolyngbya sp. NIES-2104]GAP98470.1 hypothetical protein NIES2104_50250 [Leptolyngbya sp. NIES-2104]
MPVFLLRRIMTIATIIALVAMTSFGVLTLPAHAASSSGVSSQEQIDRAYEETEAAGIQEEIYQQRLREGENPEKMPKPFKRIVDAEGKEVPQTSLIETSVSKVRELTQKVTGK